MLGNTSLAAYMPPIAEDAPAPIFRSHLFLGNARIRRDNHFDIHLAREMAISRCHPPALPGDPASTRLENESLLTCISGYGPLMAPRYPRDVPWTELPILGAAAWKPTREFFSCLRISDISEAASLQASVVFMGEDEGESPDLAGHARLEAVLGRRLPMFTLRPNAGLASVPAGLVDAAEARTRAWERFRWNWNWNVRALMPRLLGEAFRTRRPPGSRDSRPGPEQNAVAAIAQSPWLLQVLYRVAREHPKPIPFPGQRLAYPRILSGAGLSRVSGSADFRIDWTGHRVATDMPEDHPARRAFVQILERAIDQAHGAGLLLATPERHARLGPPGAALLRLLPASCRDLGMPTRWMTEEGQIGTPDDIPAMDRWLTTMLRAIKKVDQGGRTSASGSRTHSLL
jgi:hypothetical protein